MNFAERRGRKKGILLQKKSQIFDSVRKHINLIPKVESHYLRKDTSKLYLSEELNRSRLYTLYKEWAIQEGLSNIASPRQYRYVIENEFKNISFYVPKKDQCNLCEKFKNLNTSRDEGEFKVHLDEKNAARSEKSIFLLYG